MGLSISIFLAAVGAVLTFAVNDTAVDNINLDAVGVVLMVVAGIGFLASLLLNDRGGDVEVVSRRPLSSRRRNRDDLL